MADGWPSPRLVSLAEAKAYLGGTHPSALGIPSLGRGRSAKWDVKAIDAKLDQLSGLAVDKRLEAANDQTDSDDSEADELSALERKIADSAARRA